MIFFNCDYNEGAHERIIKRLVETNLEQTTGYGEDDYCRQAAEMILENVNCPRARSISWWAVPRRTSRSSLRD